MGTKLKFSNDLTELIDLYSETLTPEEICECLSHTFQLVAPKPKPKPKKNLPTENGWYQIRKPRNDSWFRAVFSNGTFYVSGQPVTIEEWRLDQS